jgi:hypothetical protein
MPSPKLSDNGTTVTLDLHGLTVDDAIDVTYATLRMAQDRGRAQLKVIHGQSTSDGSRRTIKQELYALLNRGALCSNGANVIRQRGHFVLALDLTARRDTTRIRLRDVWP